MSYSEVMKSMIENAGLTYKEVTEKIKETGETIDPSYISKLANDKIAPPSEKISKIIAKACNDDENKLILEAYLDKAPQVMIDFVLNVRLGAMIPILQAFNNTLSQEGIDILEKELLKQPLSEFMIQINSVKDGYKIDNNAITMDIDGESPVSFNMDQPVGIPVPDSSMEPLIPKGSQVIFDLKEEYANGDIVGVILNEKDLLIRRYYKENNLIILSAINPEFQPIASDNMNVKFLGKVNKAIIQF